MDQLSAHLDRGWDLAQRGDTRGAESSARRALELSPDCPEAHNLLGYVAALEGDCDEAIEAYQHAILLDDTYVEAMLNAAELLLHPMARHQDAIDMCEQVLDVTEYDDEIVDALLIKFEALSALGDTERAKKVLAALPEGPYQSSHQCFLAGRAYLETGDRARAQKLLTTALELDPHNADAHYHMGLMYEESGDRRAAAMEFLQTRQLELEMGPPPWAPNGETFLMFTERAVQALDPDLRAFVERAEVYLADLPGPEMVVDGVDPRAMILVDAVRMDPENDAGSAALTPEQTSVRIFIYALNVMRTSPGLSALESTLVDALATELKSTLEELEQEEGSEPAPTTTDGRPMAKLKATAQ